MRVLDANDMPHLQELIDNLCGGFSDTPGGDLFILPRGRFELSETLRIGHDTNASASRPSITLMGQGAAFPAAQGSDADAGATTLVWTGEPGGTMVNVLSGQMGRIDGISFRMDPSTGMAAVMAGTGIRIAGNNANSAPTQGFSVRDCIINGSRDVMNADEYNVDIASKTVLGPIGIHIDGARQNDQVDLVDISHCRISNMGTAVYQRNQQAVMNRLSQVAMTYRHHGVRVDDGHLHLLTCYLGTRWAHGSSAAIRLGQQGVGVAAQQFSASAGCHFEVIDGGFLHCDTTPFPWAIRDSSLLMQSTTNLVMLVAYSKGKGKNHFMGNTIGGKGGNRTAVIAQSPEGELIVSGNTWRGQVDHVNYHGAVVGPVYQDLA